MMVLVSGGVDSTVTFALIHTALGPDRTYGLFVDNGLLRMGEKELVTISLRVLISSMSVSLHIFRVCSIGGRNRWNTRGRRIRIFFVSIKSYDSLSSRVFSPLLFII